METRIEKTMSQVEHSEAVVRLFSQHQRWLYGYLMALLGNANDAEDVFQEVCVVMWQEHEKFEIGTNFVSWLSVIAYHQVQKFWRLRKRNRNFLNQEILEQIAESMPTNQELHQARRKALSDCLQILAEPDRELVRHRYSDRKISTKATAKELGRPTGTVYKALSRIRKSLFDCVNRKLTAEGMV